MPCHRLSIPRPCAEVTLKVDEPVLSAAPDSSYPSALCRGDVERPANRADRGRSAPYPSALCRGDVEGGRRRGWPRLPRPAVDRGRAAPIIAATAGRSPRERPVPPGAGAEGATAPETLRRKDRGGTALWKAESRRMPARLPPKGKTGRVRVARCAPVNLSGPATEGAGSAASAEAPSRGRHERLLPRTSTHVRPMGGRRAAPGEVRAPAVGRCRRAGSGRRWPGAPRIREPAYP